MNSNLALFLGFVIGVAAGGSGMYLAHRRPPAPPAPAPSTNAVRELAAAVSDKRARGPTWWDMDAPTPDILAVQDTSGPAPVLMITNVTSGGASRTNRWQREDDWRNLSQEDREKRFQSYWSNQQVAARANLITNAVLGEHEAVRFDVLTAAMNLHLKERLDPVIQQYQTGWRPSPEERTRLALEVSAILVDTYDEMDRSMPEGWREGLTNTYFSLTQFVEPQYMPFVRGMGGMRGPWGGDRGGPPPGFGPPPAPSPQSAATQPAR